MEDDGVGFDRPCVENPQEGRGLSNVREAPLGSGQRRFLDVFLSPETGEWRTYAYAKQFGSPGKRCSRTEAA